MSQLLRSGTSKMGMGVSRSTAWLTLPTTSSNIAPRPCVPMTIRSAPAVLLPRSGQLRTAEKGVTIMRSRGTNVRLSELLFDGHRRPYGSVFEKWSRHSSRQADAAMRRSVRRNIALVHRVATPEEHGVRHLRAIEMRARRPAILTHINVEPHDVAIIIHVIAKNSRDMICIL